MRRYWVLLAAFVMVIQASAPAQVTGHYVNGVEGIRAATLPPPGWYYRNYQVFYNAGAYRTTSGQTAPIGFDVSVYAMAHRVIWISDIKILGGYYGADILIPMVNTDLRSAVPGLNGSNFGLGDIFVEPITLSWHGPRYDTAIGLGFYAPTGSFSATNPASAGKDFWTLMPTFGATLYLTEDQLWSVSLLGRYEWHSKMGSRDVTPGQDFHFEWGIGNTIPTKNAIWELGLSGYAQWQMTSDSGADVTWNRRDHDSVFAAGPEIDVFIPSIKTQFQLRALFEFGAHDRSMGNTLALTSTKIF